MLSRLLTSETTLYVYLHISLYNIYLCSSYSGRFCAQLYEVTNSHSIPLVHYIANTSLKVMPFPSLWLLLGSSSFSLCFLSLSLCILLYIGGENDVTLKDIVTFATGSDQIPTLGFVTQPMLEFCFTATLPMKTLKCKTLGGILCRQIAILY